MIPGPLTEADAQQQLSELRYNIAVLANRNVLSDGDKWTIRRLEKRHSELMLFMRKCGWEAEREEGC